MCIIIFKYRYRVTRDFRTKNSRRYIDRRFIGTRLFFDRSAYVWGPGEDSLEFPTLTCCTVQCRVAKCDRTAREAFARRRILLDPIEVCNPSKSEIEKNKRNS